MHLIVNCFGDVNYRQIQVLHFKEYYPEIISTSEWRGKGGGYASRSKVDAPRYIWICDCFRPIVDSMENPEAWSLTVFEKDTGIFVVSLAAPHGSYVETITSASRIIIYNERVRKLWNDVIEFITRYNDDPCEV